jgi:hypothetical protein
MKGRLTMKCPYCAEEIQDAATVCRHCDRDFGIFKPLLLKVGALEEQIAELQPPTQRHADESEAPVPQMPLLAVVACVLLTSGYYFSVFQPPTTPEANLPYLLAIIAPPSLVGFAVGRSWRGGSLRGYSVGGLTVGLLNLIAVAWIIDRLPSNPHFNWPWALLLFAVGQPLLFITGAFIGDSIEDKKFPGRKGPRSRTGFEDWIERFARGSKNLQIIFGFVAQLGSIVFAVFAFFGFRGGR